MGEIKWQAASKRYTERQIVSSIPVYHPAGNSPSSQFMMFPPGSNSSSINYSFLPLNPTLFLSFTSMFMLKILRFFFHIPELHPNHNRILSQSQIPELNEHPNLGTHAAFALFPPTSSCSVQLDGVPLATPPPPSLCKQITRIIENMISIFFCLYLHYGWRVGALMKFKDKWRPRYLVFLLSSTPFPFLLRQRLGWRIYYSISR